MGEAMSLLQEQLQVGRIALPDLTTENAWLAFGRGQRVAAMV
ncbi:hypothetical protein AB0942_28820 [Streptomyces nodosus]